MKSTSYTFTPKQDILTKSNTAPKSCKFSLSEKSHDPLSILLVTDSMGNGGAQTHILTLAEELLSQGNTVTVASSGGELTERLSALGIRHITLPPCRPRYLFKTCRILQAICQSETISCIHAHARFVALSADLVARRLRLPLVVTAHARFCVDPLRRHLSRWGIRTIAVSEDLSRYLSREYGVPKKQIAILPNGIQPPSFALPVSDKPRLVFCSRLDKDCSAVAFLLCDIAERLHDTFPELEILFIGGGDALPSLQKRIHEVHLATKSSFLFCAGALKHPIHALRSNDCFVGVSRAALEAMSVGIPVILAGNEGFLGMLNENNLSLAKHTNFCCRGLPSPTAQTLFSACRKLLSLPQQDRHRLGHVLASYVQTHHAIESVTKQTAFVYRDAIQRNEKLHPKRLVLCGYYGYGNLGDDTLLQEALKRAKRQYPTYAVSVLTAKKTTATEHHTTLILRTSPRAVLAALRQADLLVFGGGTLLQDTTSLRSLLYYAAILRYAQAKGTRCELWANGLGRPRTSLGAHVMRAVLSRCDHVGLRDAYSIALAKSLGVHPQKIVREDDLALGLLADKEIHLNDLIHSYRLGRRFAVIAPKGKSNKRTVRRLQKHLTVLRKNGITLLFVAFFPKEDLALCRKLCRSNRDRIATDLSAQELIGLMERSVGVLGMRLHALIFAKNAGVPFLGFGEDEKLQSFCDEYGAQPINE